MPIVPWGQIVQDYIAEDRCVTQQTALWPNGKPFVASADEVRRLFLPSIARPVVDCQQFQQLITSAVDQRLTRLEMEAFVDHAAKCHTCRYDYELESAARTIVQSRLKMVKTPHALTESIARKIHQIDQEEAATEKKESRAKRPAFPFLKPMLVIALLGAAVYAIMLSPFGFGPTPGMPMGSDLLAQSVSNFHAVLAGVMQPQLVSDKPDQVRQWLSEKTSFSVHVPALNSCTLVGASANEYHGMKLAHVVYKHDGQVIYLFQAPYDRVMEGNGLVLSADAKVQLAKEGSFSNVAPGGDTVILWVLGNTLCAAVSRIDRKEMTKVLAASEDAPAKIGWQ
jgi:hypothetical protein